MFPDPHDQPAGILEGPVGLSIPFAIPFDLLLPEGSVRLGLCAMLRTAIPEAAVDEDRQALPRKDDVGMAAYPLQRRPVHTVSQPKPV
jgi:hypothetical protein